MRTADDLFTQALALPVPEHAALAQQLLHSLEPEDPDAEEAWADEIQARSDALNRGELTVRNRREALDDIRKQLHK
jgi:putative addiction module component (TIGR02574 family)